MTTARRITNEVVLCVAYGSTATPPLLLTVVVGGWCLLVDHVHKIQVEGRRKKQPPPENQPNTANRYRRARSYTRATAQKSHLSIPPTRPFYAGTGQQFTKTQPDIDILEISRGGSSAVKKKHPTKSNRK
ncbi:unnamed protein product [Ectocarpus sp. 12 AP-2014]